MGEGSYGIVRSAIHKKANIHCAIKMVNKSKIVENAENPVLMKELIDNELQVLEDLSHPHMMHIYELLEDDENYYIVSEII